MAGRLQDKVAVITGGCSGMGLATAELFIAEGARVVVADVQADKGPPLEARFDGRLRFARCDVTREDDIAAAFDLAVKSFGGLDILFNNAGAPGTSSNLEQMTVDGWDSTMALLLRAAVLGIKHAIPLMRARGGGSIVNTASAAGMQGGMGVPAYGVAKAAILQLTKMAATECAPQNIRVNAICPGFIATPIFGEAFGAGRDVADRMAPLLTEAFAKVQPLPRSGLPKDIAETCLFLASEVSSFITGTEILVDGGLLVKLRSDPRPGSPDPVIEGIGRAYERASSGESLE